MLQVFTEKPENRFGSLNLCGEFHVVFQQVVQREGLKIAPVSQGEELCPLLPFMDFVYGKKGASVSRPPAGAHAPRWLASLDSLGGGT